VQRVEFTWKNNWSFSKENGAVHSGERHFLPLFETIQQWLQYSFWYAHLKGIIKRNLSCNEQTEKPVSLILGATTSTWLYSYRAHTHGVRVSNNKNPASSESNNSIESNFTFSRKALFIFFLLRSAFSSIMILSFYLDVSVAKAAGPAIVQVKISNNDETITFPKSLRSTDGEKRSTSSINAISLLRCITLYTV
jgi:hypothetical protein